MNTTINIVELPGAPTAWLCDACTEKHPGARTIGKAERPCDECPEAKSATVDYVATSPGAFAPAPGWKPEPLRGAAKWKQRTTGREAA